MAYLRWWNPKERLSFRYSSANPAIKNWLKKKIMQKDQEYQSVFMSINQHLIWHWDIWILRAMILTCFLKHKQNKQKCHLSLWHLPIGSITPPLSVLENSTRYKSETKWGNWYKTRNRCTFPIIEKQENKNQNPKPKNPLSLNVNSCFVRVPEELFISFGASIYNKVLGDCIKYGPILKYEGDKWTDFSQIAEPTSAEQTNVKI